MSEVRKILFSYPNINTASSVKQKDIFKIIENIKIITNATNEALKRKMRDGSLVFVGSMPSFTLEEMHNCKREIVEKYDDVRICLLKYNNVDFEKEYSLINAQKGGISHLIGLEINSTDTEIRFSPSKNELFDVNIKVGLSVLKKLLTSIMIDISLYYYYHLSNNIESRKNFSEFKVRKIFDLHKNDNYILDGGVDDIKYLPFSLPYVEELFESKVDATRIFEKLFIDFFDLVSLFNLKTLTYNLNREPINVDLYPCIAVNHINCLNNIVNDKSLYQGKHYYVIIGNNIEEKKKYCINDKELVILDAKQEPHIQWVSQFKNTIEDYSTYYVILE